MKSILENFEVDIHPKRKHFSLVENVYCNQIVISKDHINELIDLLVQVRNQMKPEDENN